jgi:hypothetical protein
VGILAITDAIHLQKVMRRAHQRPFRFDFFNSSQEKLSEASGMFDLAEHRLDNRLPSRIGARAGLGLQFSSHAINPVCTFRQWAWFACARPFAVLSSLRGHVRIDVFVVNVARLSSATSLCIEASARAPAVPVCTLIEVADFVISFFFAI